MSGAIRVHAALLAIATLTSCGATVVVDLPEGTLFVPMRLSEGAPVALLSRSLVEARGAPPIFRGELADGERLAILSLNASAQSGPFAHAEVRSAQIAPASEPSQRAPLARRDGRLLSVTSIGALGADAKVWELNVGLEGFVDASSVVGAQVEAGVDVRVPLADSVCAAPSPRRFTAPDFELGRPIAPGADAAVHAVDEDRAVLIAHDALSLITRGARAPTAEWRSRKSPVASSIAGDRIALLVGEVETRELVWLRVGALSVEESARTSAAELGSAARDVLIDDAGMTWVLTLDGSIFTSTATRTALARATPPMPSRDEYARLRRTGRASEPWVLVARRSLSIGDPFTERFATFNYDVSLGAGLSVAGVHYAIVDGAREIWLTGHSTGGGEELVLRERGGVFAQTPLIASSTLDLCLASDTQFSSEIRGLAVLDAHVLVPLDCGRVAAIRRSDGCGAALLVDEAERFVAAGRGFGARALLAGSNGAIFEVE